MYSAATQWQKGVPMIGVTGSSEMSRAQMIQAARNGQTQGIDPSVLKQLKRQGVVTCQTCASRKYQDGSDENVSFKSPTHISPQASGGSVRAHESEHVSNAYSKAAKSDGQVVCVSVSVQTAICPECGRSYTSGGVTNSTIKYNEENPYMSAKKTTDYPDIAGANVDYEV
jgi:hypothetical protein